MRDANKDIPGCVIVVSYQVIVIADLRALFAATPLCHQNIGTAHPLSYHVKPGYSSDARPNIQKHRKVIRDQPSCFDYYKST